MEPNDDYREQSESDLMAQAESRQRTQVWLRYLELGQEVKHLRASLAEMQQRLAAAESRLAKVEALEQQYSDYLGGPEARFAAELEAALKGE